MIISRLTKVPLRELWKHEAHSFTAWLADNLDFLSETLGYQLTLDQREIAAGAFSADIRAEDPQGNYVIIENQLERTDHDHLGKLITYMSNLEAKTAIWITSEPRPEHEAAVHWLNTTLPADTAFYLIRIEAYRIGHSEPAALFTIVAGPSLETKQIGVQKKELAERHIQRQEFWKGLLELSKARTPIFSNRNPGIKSWISGSAGRRGFGFNYVINMDSGWIELYIDTGDRDENKGYFDRPVAQKDRIEKAFGQALLWQRLDDRRASRIRFIVSNNGLQDTSDWAAIQNNMVNAMVRLIDALRPELKNL
jgi:hypothetical protein